MVEKSSNEPLLAPRDAGRILGGISTSRVLQLDKAGLLHAIRDSAGRRLFHRKDVLRLVKRRLTKKRRGRQL